MKLAEKEYDPRLQIQGADHDDTRNAEKLVRALLKELGYGNPERRQGSLLGAIRSLFGKADGKQN